MGPPPPREAFKGAESERKTVLRPTRSPSGCAGPGCSACADQLCAEQAGDLGEDFPHRRRRLLAPLHPMPTSPTKIRAMKPAYKPASAAEELSRDLDMLEEGVARLCDRLSDGSTLSPEERVSLAQTILELELRRQEKSRAYAQALVERS